MAQKIKAMIMGDLILDSYIIGDVNRISPEAPVPILLENQNYDVLGGALNTAQNLKNLGVEVFPSGVIGKDISGNKILKILNDENIVTDYIYKDKSYTTSTKIRLASKNHHLLRLDKEEITSKAVWNDYCEKSLNKLLKKIDFLLISDYGKGLCSKKLLQKIINKCKANNIKVFIDPKGNDYNKYKNSFCITPNTLEAEMIIGKKLFSNNDFDEACELLCKKYNIDKCVITRGSDGASYYDGKKSNYINAKKVDVFDVSGAGDTFISCLAYHLTKTKNKSFSNSIKFANNSAGETVKYFGTKAVQLNK